jgi:hypothetical protein
MGFERNGFSGSIQRNAGFSGALEPKACRAGRRFRLERWYLVGGVKSGHGLDRWFGKHLAVVCAFGLLSLVPTPASTYECSGWTPLRLWDGSFSVPRERQGYLVHNNTGTVVFVYHPETRSRYTFAPGRSGRLGQDGRVLKFHPSEIVCGSIDCSKRCIVRLALINLVPVVVLELAGRQPPPGYASVPRRASGPVTPPRVRPAASRRVRARPVEVSREPSEIVRVYLEKMVHIYCRYRGVELRRRLEELKDSYTNKLRRVLPQDVVPDVGRYESVCRCVNELAASGMNTTKIFAEKRCGDASTRQLRARIIDRLRTRVK